MRIIITENDDELILELSSLIEGASNKSIESKNVFNIGLSGGTLVKFLTCGLPSIKTDFSKWRLFFCDERIVPADDPDSTFGVYKENLSEKIGLKDEQFVSIKPNTTATKAAQDYSEKLKNYFPGEPLPTFDMLLLGMGPDGHTCSLFPGHKLLEETGKWVAPVDDSPKPPPSRITFTFPVINNANYCVFAISGDGKADMVKRVLMNKEDFPATRVRPVSGNLVWILDKTAAKHVVMNR